MSITLSISPAVVQEVRAWAEENGTSLNQYVRDCLELKVNEIREKRKSAAEKFMELTERCCVHVPKGWKFDRAALYEGRFK